MSKLDEARQIINSVDEQMAELFSKRMEAVKLVAEYKAENGLPITDTEREKLLIKKSSEKIEDEMLREYFVNFQQNVMEISKSFQHRMLKGMKVAFSGVEGAYAHIAAGRIFPDGEKIGYKDFKATYDAVVSGECDVAVLPIENSDAGEVGQVIDLIFHGSLFVNAVYPLAIHHNLVALPGATKEGIKRVVSHQQALDQCARYIRKHGWETQTYVNTARAAQLVAESGDLTLAAVASRDTARLYGLELIKEHINEREVNTTRFAVLSRSMHKSDATHSIIVFDVMDKAGALAKAMNIIGNHGYNMRCIKSRSTKDAMWSYYFYAEIIGNLQSRRGSYMLDELSDHCKRLKFVGTFTEPTVM